ncbi:hypothetical protein BGAL_0610g00010 [Botrytis galanthina]|uniref:Beta-lactamase-related domain-containing protein n=1 Tax=Botrytis galanthina TaxID=278940 RepID=A0A4S8QV43_9HELO|nr:hypothetical protein BGAL_0610g00010 [Botrytis galanthina]
MTVLQLILEHITDKAFLDLITEDNYAIAHYIGYAACKIPFRENPEQAAAVLWNTPTDLLKPVHALHRSLKLSDQTGLLHKEVAQELLTDVSRTVAMGWFAPREPGNSFGHGGSNEPGWRRFLVGYTNLDFGAAEDHHTDLLTLDTNCGIVLMTNSAAGSEIGFKVVNAIACIR